MLVGLKVCSATAEYAGLLASKERIEQQVVDCCSQTSRSQKHDEPRVDMAPQGVARFADTSIDGF